MRRSLSRFVLAGLLGAAIVALTSGDIRAQQTVIVTSDQVGGGVFVSGVSGGIVQDGAPPRDQGPAPTGTGRIRGRVVDAATGTPVRRAQVRLFGAGIRVQKQTQSDGNGRFEFTELPAGRFTLSGSKSGYVDTSYGQLAPTEPGRPITLADKQTIDTISLAIPRGGVITGRVLDEAGEPITDVQVMALRMQFINGRRQPMPTGRSDQTNDIGEFRLYGLPPGQFTVAATAQRSFGPTDATASGPADRFGYAQTYYPSTANPAEAQAVTLATSQHVSELSIMLVSTRTAVVSGSALDSSGRPLGRGSVMAMQTDLAFGGPGQSGMLRPDGTFSIAGLPPGSYTLRAMVPNPTPGAMPETSVATVEVNGSDVTGVVLMPLRPLTFEGRVIVDAAAGTFRPQSVRVIATPGPGVIRTMMMNMPSQPPQPVRDDLTFTLTTMPGEVVIRPQGLPPGWMVRAIRLNGRDISSGVKLTEGDRGELEVELSDRAPSLQGSMLDGRGAVSAEANAFVFPQDEQLWAAPPAGHFAATRGDEAGHFTIRSLLPGDYYVVAIDRVLGAQMYDPEFLARIRPSATRITLQEGDTKSIDLRVVQPRQ